MPRTRNPHPVDLANADIFSRAVRFDVALFLGAGRYAKASAPTLAEAEAEAARLANAHAATSAKPLIYGVTVEGRSALVTAPPARGGPAKAFSSRFNAKRAAQAVLGKDAIEDRDFATKRGDDGWIWTPLAGEAPQKGNAAGAVGDAAPRKTPVRATRTRVAAATGQPGQLPSPPDFSAATHARFRAKLATLIAMAEAGDAAGLKAVAINPVSTSPKAMARYRDRAVLAIEARAAADAAAQTAA